MRYAVTALLIVLAPAAAHAESELTLGVGTGLSITRTGANSTHLSPGFGVELDWFDFGPSWLGARAAYSLTVVSDGTSAVRTRRVGHGPSGLLVVRGRFSGAALAHVGFGVAAPVVHTTNRALGDSTTTTTLAPALAWSGGLDVELPLATLRFAASGTQGRRTNDQRFLVSLVFEL